jgi:hypothetical protein
LRVSVLTCGPEASIVESVAMWRVEQKPSSKRDLWHCE